jgi:lipoprotein-anchoring transpeptidase ErfK/SrfK
MKRFVPIVILIFLLAIAGGVIFGFIRGKQRRDAEMTEFYLCETRFNEEQYQKAVQLLEAFLQEHPKSEKAADAYYYLAIAREKLGDGSRAMAAWSKIIESYPKSPNRAEAYYHLGVGYQDLDQYDKAMDNYKIVVNRFGNLPMAAGAWHGMGRIYEMKGQEPEAVDAYRNAVEKYPDTEFSAGAERRWGDINLRWFLRDNTTSYEVKSGDSLVTIAAKFHITPELIMRLNNLRTNVLQSGQILKVIKSDFNILVDLSSRKLSLRAGDTVIKTHPITIGKDETPTPVGDFKVTDKLPNPVWYSTAPSGAKLVIPAGDPRNELGTRWIGFKPAYGIHGTIDPESIGKAMSKGCVRMHNQDVEELYDLVTVGTPVKIVAGVTETRESASESQARKMSVSKLGGDRELPGTIISTLDKNYPGWKFPDVSENIIKYFRTAKSIYDPNLIWGDFNADGTKDYAVQITHGDLMKVIAFLSRDSDFDSYVLTSGSRSDSSAIETYLSFFKRGEQDYDYDADEYFLYPRDSIGVMYFGKAGWSYIFEDGKFRRVASAD